MTIKIGDSSINSIYVGDTAVKSVYLGDNLVYSRQSEPVIEIDDSYNYFVFDTSLVEGSTTVGLYSYRGQDQTEWDGLTSWGDGTVDTALEHTYAKDGIYTVKTKYGINNAHGAFSGTNARKMLIECLNINKNHTWLSNMFYMCLNLKYVKIISNIDVLTINSMFARCPSLVSVDLSSINVSNVSSVKEMFYKCSSLVSINISGWNLESAEDNSSTPVYMFKNCNSLTRDNIIMTGCNDATIAYINREFNAK